MGLIQEVQKLADNNEQLKNEYIQAKKEAEQATQKAEQLAKKLELARQQKENQKEYERGLLKAVENDLITTFSRSFENEGLEDAYMHLRLKQTRDEILDHVPENDAEWHFVNDNYEKILEKVKKIYKNDFEAKKELKDKYGHLMRDEESQKWIDEMNREAEKNQREANREVIFENITAILGVALLTSPIWGRDNLFYMGLFPFCRASIKRIKRS